MFASYDDDTDMVTRLGKAMIIGKDCVIYFCYLGVTTMVHSLWKMSTR